MKYGFIYLTTNLINGKKYIGQRKYHPKNINSDNKYLGSGIYLVTDIKKYGKENFSREILEECDTLDELNKAEIKWIAKFNATIDKNFYNVAAGGLAGDTWTGRSQYKKNKFRKIIANSNKTRKRDISKIMGSNNPAFGRHWYKDIINRKQYYLYENDPLINELHLIKGLFRSKKHNKKISESNKGKHKKSPIKGKISVSKDNIVKFINIDELEMYLNEGYYRGNCKTKIQHRVYMNNGSENKLINKKQINNYIKHGWQLGKLKNNVIV